MEESRQNVSERVDVDDLEFENSHLQLDELHESPDADVQDDPATTWLFLQSFSSLAQARAFADEEMSMQGFKAIRIKTRKNKLSIVYMLGCSGFRRFKCKFNIKIVHDFHHQTTTMKN